VNCFLVGLGGPIAAGKTTAGRYLESKGFYYARFSTVIDQLLGQAGLPTDRSHRQEMGARVHRSPGQEWLCRELMRRVPNNVHQVVIDGLRFLEDREFFVNRYGFPFLHLHVTAPHAIRQSRYIYSGGTVEDFQNAEGALTESQHDRMSSLAHAIVENQLDLSHLRTQLDRTIYAARPDPGGVPCQ
jgi:dephospho-CoA kinase